MSYVSDPISREPIRRAASFSRLASDLQRRASRKMLSLAALTAAAQLDDDAPSGYVASYSEGEHTVQSELFYLPPSHSVEKRLREMASEVDRRWARAVDWIGQGPGSSRLSAPDMISGSKVSLDLVSRLACEARRYWFEVRDDVGRGGGPARHTGAQIRLVAWASASDPAPLRAGGGAPGPDCSPHAASPPIRTTAPAACPRSFIFRL